MLTTDLLEDIKANSFAPEGQTTFTDAQLLKVADNETMTKIVPALLKIREEYLISHYDYAITAGKSAYPIPARSVGIQIRDLHIIDGNQVTPDVPRTEPERINTTSQGTPDSFYLKGNDVILFPTPNATTRTLRLYFPLRPSALVLPTASAVVTAINGLVVTVGTIVSTWVTGNIFDLIKQDGGHECLAIDLTSTLVSGSDITFSELPSTLRVGDYVSLQNTTPLVQLPAELVPVLSQGAAAKVLENMNQSGASAARKEFKEMLETGIVLLTPRTVGEARVIVNNQWNI
jgi:hypothetical protein